MFGYRKLYRLENGKLWVSKELKELRFEPFIVAKGGQTVEFELNYEAEASNFVVLRNCHREVIPVMQTKNKAIWRYRIKTTQRLCFYLPTDNELDYKIVNARIVLHD